MHQPGYVQGGQEVGRDYLLLGIHYRRIREHSTASKTTPQQLTSGRWHLKKKKFRRFVNTIAQFTNMQCIHSGFYK
jgi:hypothetical protein